MAEAAIVSLRFLAAVTRQPGEGATRKRPLQNASEAVGFLLAVVALFPITVSG